MDATIPTIPRLLSERSLAVVIGHDRSSVARLKKKGQITPAFIIEAGDGDRPVFHPDTAILAALLLRNTRSIQPNVSPVLASIH